MGGKEGRRGGEGREQVSEQRTGRGERKEGSYEGEKRVSR